MAALVIHVTDKPGQDHRKHIFRQELTDVEGIDGERMRLGLATVQNGLDLGTLTHGVIDEFSDPSTKDTLRLFHQIARIDIRVLVHILHP